MQNEIRTPIVDCNIPTSFIFYERIFQFAASIILCFSLSGCFFCKRDLMDLTAFEKVIYIYNMCSYPVYYSIQYAEQGELYTLNELISFNNINKKYIEQNKKDAYSAGKMTKENYIPGIQLGHTYKLIIYNNTGQEAIYTAEQINHNYNDDFLNVDYDITLRKTLMYLSFCPKKVRTNVDWYPPAMREYLE
jgi:hypothetical protein